MPRDKTASHEKIVKAAMEEFLTRGYEQASMKAVADAVEMTSAALYRHFASKQDMFAALVQPALDALEAWTGEHEEMSFAMLDMVDPAQLWDFDGGMNDAGMVLDVAYRQPDVFRLLFFRSAGTPYENYVHDIIESATDQMMAFVMMCRQHGYPAKELSRSEMHMLVTTYTMAMLEPLEHGYSRDEAEKYLRMISDFFTPGWRMITGI